MKISQSEARRLKKRVKELEGWAKSKTWDWSTGQPFKSTLLIELDNSTVAWVVQTARRLNHAVVVVDKGGTLEFYGIREESKP